MPTLAEIPTPALLLDRGVLRRNIATMSERMRALGVALRPHLKTAKSVEIARLLSGNGEGPITVSTLAEASWFARHGFHDQVYAVGIAPQKLDAVAGLLREGVSLKVITDDAGAARAIAERGRALGVTFPTLVEVDTGGHRGGVEIEAPELLEIGDRLSRDAGSRLEGVLTHAGHSYECATVEQIREVAEQERAGIVRAAERLRDAGLECATVSAGSTPTAVHAESLAGVTEMRPGNFVFFDLYQEGLGCCTRADLAVSVLATVIGHVPRQNRLLVDAGALALSLDNSASRWDPKVAHGIAVETPGAPPLAGLKVRQAHQEHGFVESDDPLPFERLPIGTRVRVLPSHACATAAMFDRYHVTDGGAEVVEVWERTNRW
jgi:D-serine deaminase-like pyridoxal phosphate-dependent protein